MRFQPSAQSYGADTTSVPCNTCETLRPLAEWMWPGTSDEEKKASVQKVVAVVGGLGAGFVVFMMWPRSK